MLVQTVSFRGQTRTLSGKSHISKSAERRTFTFLFGEVPFLIPFGKGILNTQTSSAGRTWTQEKWALHPSTFALDN